MRFCSQLLRFHSHYIFCSVRFIYLFIYCSHRLIPETSHPAPQALDEKPSPSVDYDSASETNARNHSSSPITAKPARKSIYEMSSDEEDNREDDSIRSPSDDDSQDSRKQNPFALSKDKDMRISAMFMDKDYSNGDIDLRLPFKPVMANYIPATEIDASITSHAPITYEVNYRKPNKYATVQLQQ